MNKLSFSLVAIFFITQFIVQREFYSYKTISSEDKNFSFPVFNNTNNLLAAEKINQLLQLSELELLKGHEKKNIFEIVRGDKRGLYGGKTDISFQIINDNKKIISLVFNESSCGMTCAYWIRYYNFNSGNGDLIQLADLFTTEGFKTFKGQVSKKRFESLAIQIDSSGINADLKEDFLEEEKNCFNDDNLSDFFIKGTSIILDGENCLNKNEKGFELDMECEFKLNEFKSYLNNYGKAIFINTPESVKTFRSKQLPQLFSGTIDSHPVLMIIRPTYEKEVEGIYTYLKSGIGINLEGSLNDHALYLKELTANFEENASITATYNWNEISGIWQNKDATKKLNLKIKRK